MIAIDQFPLAQRDALFDNPTSAWGKINPNGTWLRWRSSNG